MLAERVADERSSSLGQEIGYQTRFEKQVSDKTRACFITEGILPRMLLNDPNLNGYPRLYLTNSMSAVLPPT